MKNNKLKSTPSITLQELFETLNFYADKENYYSSGVHFSQTKINKDYGAKARKILKKFLKDGFFYVKI